MANIIEILKQQIENQTKEHLNTNLDSIQPLSLGRSSDVPEVGFENPINPVWYRGKYSLERDTEFTTGITSAQFRNYSGNVDWKKLTGKEISEIGLPRYTNMLLGIQVLSSKDIATFPIEIETSFGHLNVYYKSEGDSTFETAYSAKESGKHKVNIYLTPNVWVTIAITFYAIGADAFIKLVPDYNLILAWRELDLITPAIPQWATPSLQREVIDYTNKSIKIKLNWNKDTTLDFAGNGIYKKKIINSGLTANNNIPSTLLNNTYRSLDESLKWFTYTGGTLNSGDTISFSSNGDNSFKVGDIITNPVNKVTNPIFNAGVSGYAYSGFSLKNNIDAKISKNYFLFDNALFNTKRTLLNQTPIPVSTGSLYAIGMTHSNNLMSQYRYGIGGFGITPVGWSIAGSITSAEATRDNLHHYVELKRQGSSGYFRTGISAVQLSAFSTYSISCVASTPVTAPFNISLRLNSGATVGVSSTLYSASGYNSNYVSITPSLSGAGYLQVNLPATTGTISFATMHLGELIVEQKIKASIDYKEYLRITMFDSGLSQLSTIYDTEIKNMHSIVYDTTFSVGSYDGYNPTLGDRKLPSNCAYIEVAYVATVNAISTVVGFNKNIYKFYVTEISQQNTDSDNTNIFNTSYNWVKSTSEAVGLSDGAPIYLQQLEHVVDRPRTPEDGNIVTWEDFNVEPDTTYYYALDAYDNSAFRNRSILSSIASINSGDLTAPKTPTNYTLTGVSSGVFHNWTNPTAPDLDLIKCYDTSLLATVIFTTVAGATGEENSYSEGLAHLDEVSRYLVAVDKWGNVSNYAYATGKAIPATAAQNDLSFEILITKTADGNKFDNVYNDSWYGENVTAEFVVTGNTAVASYLYKWHLIETQVPQTVWTDIISSPWKVNFIQDWRYDVQFAIKDTSGNYSSVIDKKIYMDLTAPTIINRDRFWDTESAGYPLRNYLKWTPTYHLSNGVVVGNYNDLYDQSAKYLSTWDRSGLKSIVIKKAKVNLETQNPLFLNGAVGAIPDGWTEDDPANKIEPWIYEGNGGYNGDRAVKFRVTGGGGWSNAHLKSNSFTLANNETIHAIARVTGSFSSNAANMQGRLAIHKASDNSLKAIKTTDSFILNVNLIATWYYLYTNYKNTTGSDENLVCKIGLQSSSNALINDYMLADEVCAWKTPSAYSTVIELNPDTYEYVDEDVQAWQTYIYTGNIIDNVGHVSATIPFKLLKPVQDYRDWYRNILDNGSFERTKLNTSSELVPESWDNFIWNNMTSKNTYNTIVLESNNKAFNGDKIIQLKTNFDRVIQNDIHVLPFTGVNRKFIFSAYVSKKVSGTATVNLTTVQYDKSRTAVGGGITSSSFKTNSVLTSVNDWTRVWQTFTVSDPLVTHLAVEVYGDSANTASLYVDAVQLEEKESEPPRDFFDNKSITADYLQGNLIRANMIEAEMIEGTHIKANTITSNEIAADTITANEIATDAITTSELQANSVTSAKIQANAITSAKIQANAITSAKIAADEITATELNLSGKLLFFKSDVGRIEFPYGDNIGGLCYAPGTHLQANNIEHIYYAGIELGNTSLSTLYIGYTSKTFGQGDTSVSKLSTGVNGILQVAYCRPSPQSGSYNQLIVVLTGTGAIWTSYSSTVGANVDNTNPASYSSFVDRSGSFPGIASNYTTHYHPIVLKWPYLSSSSRYYYAIKKDINNYYYGRMTHLGSPDIVNTLSITGINSMSLDLTGVTGFYPTVRTLACYCKYNDSKIYVQEIQTNSPMPLIGTAVSIQTYGGGSFGSTYPEVVAVSISYVGGGRWLIAYELNGFNLVYFKVVSMSLGGVITEVVGAGVDLSLIETSFLESVNADYMHAPIRTMRQEDGKNTLIYLPVAGDTILSNGVKVTNTFSGNQHTIGGKYRYVYNSTTVLQYEELFNRLT